MTGINREPMPFWKHREYSVPIDMPSSADVELLHRRCADSFAAFKSQMTIDMYGDEKPYIPPTRWQRFRNWLGDNRITNAWLVLIGREDVDREYR
jgi:hypothetical protein